MKYLSGWRGRGAGTILAAVAIALVASTAGAQTAEEVIEKNIKAQGGREALTNLKSIQRKGKVAVDGTFGQMEGTVEEVTIPWKKALRDLDLAVFVQTDGFNGKLAWRDGMMGLQELEGDEAVQIKQAVDINPFLMALKRGVKAEKLEDEKVDDADCYVIQLSAEGRPAVKMYVDKKDDMLCKTSLKQNNPQFGEVEIVVQNSEYDSFGPVKLAKKNKIAIGDLFTIETTYEETKVNEDVDESIFEKPEEKKADDAKPEEKKDEKKEEKK